MTLYFPFWFLFPDSNNDDELESTDFMQDVLENKNLIFQAMIIGGLLKLAKMPQGMKTIQVLGKAVIDGLFEAIDSLGQASAANHIAAWANPVLISGIFERFGLLPPKFNNGFHKGVTTIAGVDTGLNIIDAILGKGGAYPTTMAFAKKSENGGDASSILPFLSGLAGVPPV